MTVPLHVLYAYGFFALYGLSITILYVYERAQQRNYITRLRIVQYKIRALTSLPTIPEYLVDIISKRYRVNIYEDISDLESVVDILTREIKK